MRAIVYPGSFDPFTNGHVDIVRRAAKLCDVLYVVVLQNAGKRPAFTEEQRMQMAKLSLQDLDNVVIEGWDGLLVDYVQEKKAMAVVRGLRSESDFRYEAEMAAANKLLYEDYEVILMPSRTDLAFTSSSIVREVAHYGGNIGGMVPEVIVDQILEVMTASETHSNSKA